ncbi:hypothetical protein C8J56DRAFT_899280 [Mycena floridula]|nr:hypothetical protein C8J56DRAFT_899280 [Mycena floridula]
MSEASNETDEQEKSAVIAEEGGEKPRDMTPKETPNTKTKDTNKDKAVNPVHDEEPPKLIPLKPTPSPKNKIRSSKEDTTKVDKGKEPASTPPPTKAPVYLAPASPRKRTRMTIKEVEDEYFTEKRKTNSSGESEVNNEEHIIDNEDELFLLPTRKSSLKLKSKEARRFAEQLRYEADVKRTLAQASIRP